MAQTPKALESLLPDPVERYLRKLQPPRTGALAALESRALREDFPICGPQVGALLSLLIHAGGIRTVFEMGSGWGYSALWIAGALPTDGRLVLTDADDLRLAEARGALAQAAGHLHVEVRRGDALEILERSRETYDMIFCDVDKESYPDAFKIASGLINPGGLFVCDNALWKGRVAAPEPGDSHARSVDTMNRMVFSHPEFEAVMLPVHDGVLIARRAGPPPSLPLRRGEAPRRRREDR